MQILYSMNTLLTTVDFLDLSRKLIAKSIRDEATRFLESKNISASCKDTRIFLTAYMIMRFPEEVLGKIGDKEKLLIRAATKLVYNLDNPRFNEIYKFYTELFKLWKKDDSDKIEHEMSMAHWQHRQTKELVEGTSPDSIIWMEQIDKMLNKFENHIRTVSGEDAVNRIKIYEPSNSLLVEEMTNQIVDQARSTGDRVFIDLMDEKISNKDYNMFLINLEDIVVRIKKIIPRRLDLHEELDSNVDIKLYKQMFEHNAVTIDDIYKLLNYLLDIIGKLQSCEDDNDLNQFRSSKFSISHAILYIIKRLDKIQYIIYG